VSETSMKSAITLRGINLFIKTPAMIVSLLRFSKNRAIIGKDYCMST